MVSIKVKHSCVFWIIKGLKQTLLDFLSLFSDCFFLSRVESSQIVHKSPHLLFFWRGYSQYRTDIFIVIVINSGLIYPNYQLYTGVEEAERKGWKKKANVGQVDKKKSTVEKIRFQAIKNLLLTVEHLNIVKQ